MERQVPKPGPSRSGGSSAIPIAPSRAVRVQVRTAIPVRPAARPQADRGAAMAAATVPIARRAAFGLPNLRRNVCPHFYMTGTHGPISAHAPHVLKTLARQESTVSRCQLRGGVHLEQGYVSDVCLWSRFNQCVFYEDDLADR